MFKLPLTQNIILKNDGIYIVELPIGSVAHINGSIVQNGLLSSVYYAEIVGGVFKGLSKVENYEIYQRALGIYGRLERFIELFGGDKVDNKFSLSERYLSEWEHNVLLNNKYLD
ncbi:MAG: hypothetical protein MUF58_20920 [Arcicella sp.]|jgi:hypothetical protein|nr:hypothetical protein [Arcicella sp.]